MMKKILLFLIVLTCASCNTLCKYCNLLEFRKWRTDYYSEQCILSGYHEKWEDKNCQFRLVKVDPNVKRVKLEASQEGLTEIQQ